MHDSADDAGVGSRWHREFDRSHCRPYRVGPWRPPERQSAEIRHDPTRVDLAGQESYPLEPLRPLGAKGACVGMK
jgi:hypothetical protein